MLAVDFSVTEQEQEEQEESRILGVRIRAQSSNSTMLLSTYLWVHLMDKCKLDLSRRCKLDLSGRCKLDLSKMQIRFVLSNLECSAHILSPNCNAIREKFSAMGCIERMMAMQGVERQTGEETVAVSM